eukprot:m.179078 g.179078  ORF g.179078 m.179078 type:complete len:287 (+) comp53415_c0_seq2:50-910(+)
MATPNPRKVARVPTKTNLAAKFRRAFSFAKTDEEDEITLKEEAEVDIAHVPKLVQGMVTQTGSQHAHNEDRGVAFPDLLATYPAADDEYHGTTTRSIAAYFVFDGHGGSNASQTACQNLPKILADIAWKGNYSDMIGTAITHAFKRHEDAYHPAAKAGNDFSGACALCVVLKGNKLYCGNAGDSKALYFGVNGSKAVNVAELCDRFNTDNPDEVKRIRDVAGKKAVSDDGAVFGLLYPTRGFVVFAWHFDVATFFFLPSRSIDSEQIWRLGCACDGTRQACHSQHS